MIATAGQMAGAAQILDLIAKGELEVLDDLEDFLYDEILWKKEGVDKWVTIGARVQGGEALIDLYRNSHWAPYSARLHLVRPAGDLAENVTLEIAYPDPNQPHLWKPLSVTVTETIFSPSQIIEAITAKHQEALGLFFVAVTAPDPHGLPEIQTTHPPTLSPHVLSLFQPKFTRL